MCVHGEWICEQLVRGTKGDESLIVFTRNNLKINQEQKAPKPELEISFCINAWEKEKKEYI